MNRYMWGDGFRAGNPGKQSKPSKAKAEKEQCVCGYDENSGLRMDILCPVHDTQPTNEQRGLGKLDDIFADCIIATVMGKNAEVTKKAFKQAIEAYIANERKKAASDIFSLAHQYACEDKTMKGSEELRAYHYYNAIAKIGDFDGR